MTQELTIAPTLSSNPEYTPVHTHLTVDKTEEDIASIFEIDRTLSFIQAQNHQRIALQFPDELLPFSTHVVKLLGAASTGDARVFSHSSAGSSDGVRVSNLADALPSTSGPKYFVLADTSYGSCCVDEIAAEHVNADCIIHYGRACLSPTSRLPVLHIFTYQSLDLDPLVAEFERAFQDLNSKIVLMCSLPYITQLPELTKTLEKRGYTSLFETSVVHDPSSLIPNRTSPSASVETLQEWSLFHIGEPLTSLILTLASRTSSVTVYDTDKLVAEPIRTMPITRRRYAILSHIRSAGVVGILVNTLSANNYLPVIASLKQLLKDHGKKSYLFVVGKINAAKIANFAEIECWVVVSCWESSIVDEAREFWRPCVTPWEVYLSLQGGEGQGVQEWRADMETFLSQVQEGESHKQDLNHTDLSTEHLQEQEQEVSEDESAPPIFDLRTGKYISSSAPLRTTKGRTIEGRDSSQDKALSKTSKDKSLFLVNNTVSPAANFLKEKRQWTGLGSDYHETETDRDGAVIEEGRSGIARGYKTGENENKS